MVERPKGPGVLVIGLGRFGISMGKTLEKMGNSVFAVDTDPELVQLNATEFSKTWIGDATNPETLKQIGAGDYRIAVVAIGSDLEASILTTAALKKLNVPNVWAKATSDAHAEILHHVGADHVVMPEKDMGQRVAHLVTGSTLDYVMVGDDFALVEAAWPAGLDDKLLAEVRELYSVTVIAWCEGDGPFNYASPDTSLKAGDRVLIAGRNEDVEKFAQEP